MFTKAFTALRIFTGLIWLSNGLAKLFYLSKVNLGFFSGTPITKGAPTSRARYGPALDEIGPGR